MPVQRLWNGLWPKVWTGVVRTAGHALGTLGRCRACSCRLDDDADPLQLCPECAAALAPLQHGYCPACGLVHCPGCEPRLCDTCRLEPPAWDAIHFLAAYQGRLEELITGLKFHERLRHQKLLADLAILALGYRQETAAELAVPVPLHRQRLTDRGFNQSLELARHLPGLKTMPSALVRTRATTPQVRLSREERLVNLRGAFWANPAEVRGRNVLLVDDVMTTGSTVRECIRALRDAGAERVEVLVLARA